MDVDLDTFLVAVYTLVDDVVLAEIAPSKPVRRGHQPELSDSEVLTLMLCAQWLGNSERAFGRYAARHWRAYFPRLLSQSAFNRRVRDLGGACARLLTLLAREVGAETAPYQVVDGTPVPLAQLCRGKHHRLFADEASIGRGGSDKHFYFGEQALLAVTDAGVITGFVLGPASSEGRWLLEALLCWRADPAGQPWTARDIPTPSHRTGLHGGYVGPTGPRQWPGTAGDPGLGDYISDDGFCGRTWNAHWHADYAANVFTCGGYGRGSDPGLERTHHGWRQIIETVNAILNDALHLRWPGAKTWWGVVTRVTAKCAAFNLGIWLNRLLGRDDLAIKTLFPI
jgi:hypothetical protein